MRSDDLTCQELVELVTEYLEGSLPDGQRARFDRHIGTCAGCDTYLDQMRVTIGTLGALDPESLSEDARDALLDAFRSWKSRSMADGDSDA